MSITTRSSTDDINNIIKSIIDDVNISVIKHFTPFITEVVEYTNKYEIITAIMREMPEFKELVKQNKQLTEQLNSKSRSISEASISEASINEPNIKLEVKESLPNFILDETLNKVKQIYSDVKIIQLDLEEELEVEETDDEEQSEEEQAEQSEQEEEQAEQSEQEEEQSEQSEQEQAEQSEQSDQEEDVPIHERSITVQDEMVQDETVEITGEEEEVFLIEIEEMGTFYTNNDENGEIYKVDENDDVGEKIGVFKDGEPIFF